MIQRLTAHVTGGGLAVNEETLPASNRGFWSNFGKTFSFFD
jgi:hypothetical protein